MYGTSPPSARFCEAIWARDRCIGEGSKGGALPSMDKVGDEHPISFISRKLLHREERYSTIEKECLAIKLAIQTYRVYLLGRPFTIKTDHRALEWLDRIKEMQD